MRFLRSLLSGVPVALLLITIPTVNAATVGEAIKKTFDASGFTYTATANVNVGGGVQSELPFDLNLRVEEKGGKNGSNYGKSGQASATMSNFQDMPSSLGAFSKMSAWFQYRGAFLEQSKTGYGEVVAAKIDTDHSEFKKVAEMLNQFAKFMTGKAFRLSLEELNTALRQQNFGWGSDDEAFLSFLTSAASLSQSSKAFGDLLDGLVASGVLKDDTSTSGRSRQGANTEMHVLTLGSSISEQQAQQLKQTISAFVKAFMPTLAREILIGLDSETPANIARDINELLMMKDQLRFEIVVEANASGLYSIKFLLDLSPMGMPMVMKEEVVFDYSSPFAIEVPQNENNIIDINKIVDGFVAIAGLEQASYSGNEWDNSWETTDMPYQTEYHLVLDTMEEIGNYLWYTCGEDVLCTRKEINMLRRDLRKLRAQRVISNEEFRLKNRELTALRP